MVPGGRLRAARGSLRGREWGTRATSIPPWASVPSPGGHPGDVCSEAREGPTLTVEELLDARKSTARPTQEDADYDPGETHSDN